jgi:serine protease Do
LVERLLPAVVAVTTERTAAPARGAPFEARTQRRMAAGSGFMIDPAGYIVTNYHVIADADTVTITLTDESEYEATIVGADERTDLALLKIDADHSLAHVPWGDSDSVRVGDWSLAIGNPFGLGGTVTAGIISARSRSINAGIYDFLQTDAPINPGNSGGPLFDLDGAVIGVNSAIYSPTGGNVGIGFAIPAKLASAIIAQIRDQGHAVRGWLGVQIQPLTDDIAASLGLGETEGALVARVTKGSPAAAAGLEAGDVVIRFADAPIADPRALARLVGATAIGKSVAVTLLRQGIARTLDVTIAALDAQEVARATPRQAPTHAKLGLAVAPLSPDLRARYGIDQAAEGVVVVAVTHDSPAARADIRIGDLIVEAGQETIRDTRDIGIAIAKAEAAGSRALLFLVERRGQALFLAAPLGVG